MHWRISSKGRNGLKVIEEIPDFTLCLIEGPNGVGKSVAVQLLELISGHVPTSLSAAAVWTSFKENIGQTVVEIDNMAEGNCARIVFTPEQWPDTAPDTITEAIGSVTINDQPARMSDIANLIDVTTIRGDESLQDTVRSHIDRIETDLNQTAHTVRERANQIDEFIATFSSDWKRADPAAITTHTQRLSELAEELDRVSNLHREAETTSEELARALEIERKISSADADVKDMLERRTELKVQIDGLTAEIERLNHDAQAVEDALAAQGGTAAELSTVEKRHRVREARLASQRREEARWAAVLSLPADRPTIVTALKTAQTEHKRLLAEVDTIDRSRRTQDVLKRLIPVLDGAAAGDSTDVLMIVDEERYTGQQVRAGFAARSAEIAQSPRPEKALNTMAELERIKRRIGGLNAFRTAIDASARTEELLEEAKAELTLAQAKSKEASEAAATLREISEQLATSQSQLTTAHQEAVQLQGRIGLSGVSSAKEARAALTALLAKLGLEEDELDTAQATASRHLHDAAAEVDRVRAAQSVAQQASEDALTHIKTLLSEVRTSPSYAWLRDSLTAEQLDRLAMDELAPFAAVRQVVLTISDRVFDAGSQLDALARLTGLLAQPKPSKSEAAQLEQPIGAPLARALGESLRSTLNTTSIRQRVFGGLTVEELDLQAQMIILAGDGHTERRAMSAFSTGERAFAFTQARIKDLPLSPKPNRLLVLDEFGAFISADRMSDLRDFLDTLENIADQIVIILPLQVDYKAEMKDTRGELQKRYEERVRQLEARNYSAVPL